MLAAGFLALPAVTRATIFSDASLSSFSATGKGFAVAFLIVEFLIYCQWLVYVPWILRIQMQHSTRLRDLFASSEVFETRWVIGSALVMGLYPALNFVDFLLRLIGTGRLLSNLVDSIMVLIIVLTLVLWGLRQSPGLHSARKALLRNTTDALPKYERSALGASHADRIERKLNRAIEQDHLYLYRDPNLSLLALSQHIGASKNYVSQTLNERIGQSFFDNVNGWRIEEAKPLIRDGKQTVLAIAYEVGFNSPSSLYAAFKKQTAVTPSAFKSSPAAPRVALGHSLGGRQTAAKSG